MMTITAKTSEMRKWNTRAFIKELPSVTASDGHVWIAAENGYMSLTHKEASHLAQVLADAALFLRQQEAAT